MAALTTTATATEPDDDGRQSKSGVLTEAEVAAASDNHTHCLVCYSDLSIRGKTPCDHNDICGACHLRLRFLHSDKKCPICKAENERLIVDADAHKAFHEYSMWGDEIGAGFIHREDVGMFFETAYYEQEILPLFGHACGACDYTAEQDTVNHSKKHSSLRLLQDHMRTQHRLTLCSLCVDHKRDFVSQLPRMSPTQLQKHLKNGDGPTSGFNGHPVCEFCRPKRFYDLAFLHQHLHKDHYKCHVCEKQEVDDQFFKNYNSLQRHFDQQHFLCHDGQCLAARFVVFDSELDLRGHELSVHGGTSTGSTKINLEFRTRRAGYDGSGMEDRQATPSESDFNYGLDGQAFVPQALPTTAGANVGRTPGRAGGNSSAGNDNVQLHPLHLQRTEEIRAHAATIRQQQSINSQEESFPTLQASMAGGGSSAPLVGWRAGMSIQQQHRPKSQAGKVTDQDFPTLGLAPSSNNNAMKKAMKGSIGATRRQFSAMNTSAAKSTAPSAGWSGAAAPRPSAAQVGNFLAPLALAAVNRQTDLAPTNFPALGPSATVRPTYSSAHNFAMKAQQQQEYHAAPTPSVNSAADFPSMAAANRPQGKPSSVRNRVMGDSNQQKQPSQQAMSNMMQAPAISTVSARATVEEMKASLGPNKFKQLKRLTKDFAESKLSPEGYVDQSAALFHQGYADPNFWSSLPSLVDSCPNPQASESALVYMTSIKRQQFSDKGSTRNAASIVSRPVAPVPKWGNSNGHARSNMMKAPSPTPHMAQRASALTQPVAPRPSPMNHTLMASKKKTAWGGSGPATVVRAKAPPGSVAIAAANQGPQGGSATKFMAKQAKQQKAAANNQNKKSNNNNNNNNNKAKKKKEKDELRALAFGK